MPIITSTNRRPLLITATAALSVTTGLLASGFLATSDGGDVPMGERFDSWVDAQAPDTVTVVETHCEDISGDRATCYLTLDTVDSPSDTTPVRSEMFCRVYTLDDGDIHGQCPHVPWLPTI